MRETSGTTEMTERVARLRRRSLETAPSLSMERAKLLTDFHSRLQESLSAPMRRALAFQYLMEHKAICILPGELIVGERGPAPKATYTYPEICCHTLEDLDILDARDTTAYTVSGRARRVHAEEVLPYWKGRTMRERIFREMIPEWKAAYKAGVFTEFMEQRSPGHTVLDDKIYHRGLKDFEGEILTHLESLDELQDRDPEARVKKEHLKAMAVCARSLIHFAGRYAEAARALAATEVDADRRAELDRITEVCTRVPALPPRDFHEALQYYWFVHLGVIIELNTWDAFNPGRLDRHLLPFYEKGIRKGTLTREEAKELLQCFWVKFNNQPAPPKVGVTAQESSTYTDFSLINTGGLKADGSDAVNEVTFLILDVIESMRLVQPSSCVQVSRKNPDRFLKRAARILRTGYGQPSLFNTDVIVQELERQGKSLTDARNGGASGCVEAGAFGKENYNLTGYLNLPKILEITLHRGVDASTERNIGIDSGDPSAFETFGDLYLAFEKQLEYFVDIKIRGNDVIERLYARHMPAPFLSLMIDDCLITGRDYHDGGARYNTSYIQGVGLGSLTDILTAIRHHVYEARTLPLGKLLSALGENFEGRERLRQVLLNRTPRFGNDDDEADDMMLRIFESFFRTVDGRPNTRGGTYHINLLPTTVHVYFGSLIGATADGRRAGEPISEGVSPVQGADQRGPTAVFKSVAKMDHVRTGGTLLNLKLTPQCLEGEVGLTKFVQLVRSYFRLGGHHVQFNVVDAATLRDAKANPEKHRNLIVRVAGYSDYFCDLTGTLQDEIITRTEHTP